MITYILWNLIRQCYNFCFQLPKQFRKKNLLYLLKHLAFFGALSFSFFFLSFFFPSLLLYSFFLSLSLFLSETESGAALLQYSGTVSTHCNLCPPGSSDSRASASWVSGITGACHHVWLIFLFETGFHHVGQADLGLLTSSDPPASASQSAKVLGLQVWGTVLSLFHS